MHTTFKNIIIGLDLTKMDDALLRYVAFLVKVFDTQKICFVHNIKAVDLPEDWEDILSDDFSSLEEVIEENIEEKINQHFDSDFQYAIRITKSDYTAHAIAALTNELWADTIIIGKKLEYRGKGIQASKLVSIVKCNVLFVPETASTKIENLLVPIDFSRHSRITIRYARHFSTTLNASFRLLNVFRLPQRYFPYIEEGEAAFNKMKQHAQKSYQQFLAKFQKDDNAELECLFEAAKDKSITQIIIRQAKKQQADLVVVGVKGKNKMPTLVVGSVTTRLVSSELNVPLLVIKS